MEGISQNESEGFSELFSEPQKGRQELPCAECRKFDFHNIHGPVVLECTLKGCYACKGLARIDNDISTTYERLSNLFRERQEMMAKSRHDTIIHRLPVEIISSIFVFVKDAILDFGLKERPDIIVSKLRYRQPFRPPPLLVGAVCKRWREITLATPRLWTNIIVNLMKRVDGQSNMVTTWARRAGALPLDITIFAKNQYNTYEKKLPEDVEPVLSALRNVSVQWNDVALLVPGSICYKLLNDLHGIPLLGTLFLDDACGFQFLDIVKLQHPLRPRRLIAGRISSENIPLEWDRLVFINLANVGDGMILHVIRHAQNLRHCISNPLRRDAFEDPDFQIPTSFITNRSLIHLDTTCDIIPYLSLPSLSYLNYTLSRGLDESVDSLVKFINRSRPPLHEFILHLGIPSRGPFPSFETLPDLTSLFLNIHGPETNPSRIDDFLHSLTRRSLPVILPRLRSLHMDLPNSSASWTLLSRLFPEDTNSADLEAIPDTSIGPKRPLSQVVVFLMNNAVTISKDTFLRLLAVKNSGVDLSIKFIHRGHDPFFKHVAGVYDIEL